MSAYDFNFVCKKCFIQTVLDYDQEEGKCIATCRECGQVRFICSCCLRPVDYLIEGIDLCMFCTSDYEDPLTDEKNLEFKLKEP